MVTTRPPKTIVKPTALGPVANTDTKLLIYGLFQKRPSFGTGRGGETNEIDRPVRRQARITLDETGALERRAELRAEPDQCELGTP